MGNDRRESDDRRESNHMLPVASVNDKENGHRGYGWFTYRPNHLQSCLSPRWILVCCCLLVLSDAFIVAGISPVVVTSIEKRYFFQSSQIGFIFAFYEIANTISTVVISYFGHRHKPKWLGVGSFILGIGSLIFALPQLLVGEYEPVVGQTADLCEKNRTLLNALSASVENCKSSKWYIILVFIVGQAIIGVGSSPIYNLGAAYVDENTSRRNSGMYLAMYYSATAIGIGIGFLLGGHLLGIYVDIFQVCFTVLLQNERWFFRFIVSWPLVSSEAKLLS